MFDKWPRPAALYRCIIPDCREYHAVMSRNAWLSHPMQLSIIINFT